jgi:hypothetical protein
MSTRRAIFTGIGIVLFLVGGVWLLQGINVLPGSYMTGNPQWTVNGIITMIFGAGSVWFGNRK